MYPELEDPFCNGIRVPKEGVRSIGDVIVDCDSLLALMLSNLSILTWRAFNFVSTDFLRPTSDSTLRIL
eukprot:30289_6